MTLGNTATMYVRYVRTHYFRSSAAPFAQVVRHALNQTWTRDPFDRLLVGTALVDNAPLLTRDAHIRRHCKLAKWS